MATVPWMSERNRKPPARLKVVKSGGKEKTQESGEFRKEHGQSSPCTNRKKLSRSNVKFRLWLRFISFFMFLFFIYSADLLECSYF